MSTPPSSLARPVPVIGLVAHGKLVEIGGDFLTMEDAGQHDLIMALRNKRLKPAKLAKPLKPSKEPKPPKPPKVAEEKSTAIRKPRSKKSDGTSTQEGQASSEGQEQEISSNLQAHATITREDIEALATAIPENSRTSIV